MVFKFRIEVPQVQAAQDLLTAQFRKEMIRAIRDIDNELIEKCTRKRCRNSRDALQEACGIVGFGEVLLG